MQIVKPGNAVRKHVLVRTFALLGTGLRVEDVAIPLRCGASLVTVAGTSSGCLPGHEADFDVFGTAEFLRQSRRD